MSKSTRPEAARFLEDQALLQQARNTGLEGIQGIVKFVQDATPEVSNLLKNECDVIYECRYCRNMFRSLLNFIAHKRQFCRGFHQPVAHAYETFRKAIEHNADVLNKEIEQSREKETEKESRRPTKNPSGLRRTNIITPLVKRSNEVEIPVGDNAEKTTISLHTLPRIAKEMPMTVFEDGTQKVVGSVAHLAQKDTVPEDRTLFLMPSDMSSKYREMTLRSRRDVTDQTREMTSYEISCLTRCEQYCQNLADPCNLVCTHPECVGVKPFSSVRTLCYHISVKHVQRTEDADAKIPCLLCKRRIQKWTGYYVHLDKVHREVRSDHETYRKLDGEIIDKRKTKQKGPSERGSPIRSRSMSPDVDGPSKDAKENSDDTSSASESSDTESDENEDQKEEETANCGTNKKITNNGAISERNSLPTRRKIKVPMKYRDDDSSKAKDIGTPQSGSPVKRSVANSRDASRSRDASLDRASAKRKTLKNVHRSTSSADTVAERLRAKQETEQFGKDIGEVVRGLVHEVSHDDGLMKGDCPYEYDTDDLSLASIQRASRAVSENVHPLSAAGKKFPFLNVGEAVKTAPAGAAVARKKLKRRSLAIDTQKDQQSTSDETPRVGRKRKTQKPEHSSDDEEPQSSQELRPSRNRRPPTWIQSYLSDGAVPGKKYVIQQKKADDGEGDDDDSKMGNSDDSAGNKASTSQQMDSKTSTTKKDAGNVMSEESYLKRKKIAKEKKGRPAILPPVLESMQKNEAEASSRTPVKLAELSSDDLRARRFSFTPRARRFLKIDSPQTSALPVSPSKRKQNLNRIATNDDDEVKILSVRSEQQPHDLAMVPVYLSSLQKELFFSPLKPVSPGDPETKYVCTQCQAEVDSLRMGRRHMVTHIRVMRLRCKLCSAGSFFCTDLRAHLMERGCDKLHLAPEGVVSDGIPCMTTDQADSLSELVNNQKPGCVMYTSGKIVSIANKRPYFPDPVIEERILGRPVSVNSDGTKQKKKK